MLTRANPNGSVVAPSHHSNSQSSTLICINHSKASIPVLQCQLEFKKMCFYFDQIDQITLTKYSTFIIKFGGRIVESLDFDSVGEKSEITHIISERHLPRKEPDDMQRKCILRPRKPSTQDTVYNGSYATGNAENVPTNQMLPSIPSATTMNLSFDSLTNTPSTSQHQLQSTVTGTLPNYALFTPITSNNNSIPSSINFFLPQNSQRTHRVETPLRKNCKNSNAHDENTQNDSNLCADTLEIENSFDILQFAHGNGIVVWSKDELRACLLQELKKYESSKPAKVSNYSNICNESKGLAEYLAEERKNGGTNRNAVTNLNISTGAISKKLLKCNELSFNLNTPFAKASTALQGGYPTASGLSNSISNYVIPTSAYHVFKFPFILIEDAKQECKPIYKEYSGEEKSKCIIGGKTKKANQTPSILPKLNLKVPYLVCPFIHMLPQGYNVTCGISIEGNTFSNHQVRSIKGIIEERCRKRKMSIIKTSKQKGKPGFCECCYEVYTDLEKHSNTSIHRSFATCTKNYQEIDILIESLQRPIVVSTPQSPKSPSLTYLTCPKHPQNNITNDRDDQKASPPFSLSLCEGSCDVSASFHSPLKTESHFVNSEILKSPCVRAKRKNSALIDCNITQQWDLTAVFDENSNRNCMMDFAKKMRCAVLSSSRSTEIVDKINSLLQVITSNAERRDDDLTVHQLK